MTEITIRDVEDDLIRRLDSCAARNDRTLNDEVLAILVTALAHEELPARSGA